MKARKLFTLWFLLFLIGAMRSSCIVQGQVKREVERKVVAVPNGSVQPTTGFSVSYSVQSRLELSDGPVKVIGNENRIEDGIGMSKVRLENVSNQEVEGIKLRWYLFNDERSKLYVKDGETNEIKVDHFAAKSEKVVESGLPTFDEMFSSLAKDGFISGRYDVEVVVDEVRFTDGTTWKQPKKPADSVPKRSAEHQSNIPKEIWEPIFFKTIDERTKLSNLKSLRSDALSGDDLEVRVWHGFGLTALEGFILRRSAGAWSAIHLEGVKRAVASTESQKNLPAPKSGWDVCWQRLQDAGILTLPDAATIGCNGMMNDGMSYVVEYNRDGNYRTYLYDNPDYAKCDEANRVIRIGNLISDEFGVREMATK